MARDRQRAKRRQAERREARLRDRDDGSVEGTDAETAAAGADPGGNGRSGEPPREPGPPTPPDDAREPARAPEGDVPPDSVLDPAAEARLAAAAPPATAGRSDTVVESPPPAPHLEEGDDERDSGSAGAAGPDATKERGRVMAFLVAVWAELQRVQWPDRKTLTTLTGVVLGFVLIAGGYLGLLDAIFSRLIQALL